MAAVRDRSSELGVMLQLLDRYYLYPDGRDRVGGMLRDKMAAHAYDGCVDDEDFAAAVSVDTVATSADMHLLVRYSVAALPDLGAGVPLPDSGRHPEWARLAGHGFPCVQILPGNIGYLEIGRFLPTSTSGRVAAAALAVIAGTDALIIDLRGCPGGEPDMVALVCSHLVDERTELTGIHFPAESRTEQWWTDSYVPAPFFGGHKPVWVLIGPQTFSAAEAFSYHLQQQGRAVLVGEPTGSNGAGRSGFDYRYRVAEHLMFSVPSGLPVHPRSRANWETTGVHPEITVPAAEALRAAQLEALRHVVSLGAAGHRCDVAADAARALAAMLADPGR